VVGVTGADGKGLSGPSYRLNDRVRQTAGHVRGRHQGNKIRTEHTVEEPKPGVSVQLTLEQTTCSSRREADRAGGQAVQGQLGTVT